MVFNSTIFIYFFLLLFLLAYLLINPGYRKVLLIVLSFVFYGYASITNLCLFITIIFVNYIGISYYVSHPKIKKASLYIGAIILFNLFILLFFKYHTIIPKAYHFFDGSIASLMIPLGISFFTFSNISFIVDIYKGEAKLCSITDYICYVSIFTKVISGPIMLYRDFYSQIGALYTYQTTNLAEGIERFIIGLGKKVIIADILALTADRIFNQISGGLDAPTAWLGAICYTFQIYYDFSGYSDMAIGLSKIFNLKIKENFDFPYQSKSITEFWRRWHISLGSWFRTYVYIPLGGNRKGNVFVNIFIVFLLTGIWHGSSLNFVLWGCCYGILMIIERILFKKSFYQKIPGFIKCIATFLIVNFLWVIFRTPGWIYGIKYIFIMIGAYHSTEVSFAFQYFVSNSVLVTLGIAIFGAFAINLPILKTYFKKIVNKNGFKVIKYCVLLSLFLLTLIYITNSTFSPNIYFQF